MPLYGLDDASSKFWLQVKEVLQEIGIKDMEGDEAFYYLHQDGELQGAVITHVDDFTLAGTEDFIKKVLETYIYFVIQVPFGFIICIRGVHVRHCTINNLTD